MKPTVNSQKTPTKFKRSLTRGLKPAVEKTRVLKFGIRGISAVAASARRLIAKGDRK